MTTAFYFQRQDRGVVTVAGADRLEFLQGLISNDAAKAGDDRAIWSALLTPQGKFRHDFFLVAQGHRLLIECESGDRLMDLGVTLRRYVLRADVKLGVAKDLAVFQVAGDGALDALGLDAEPGAAVAFAGGVAFVDPRLADAGARVLAPADQARAAFAEAEIAAGEKSAWDAIRIPLGLPDGSADLQVDKAILLENGFDELGGVDWNKGCYMGQELTARTKYRGLVKKRLTPVRLEGGSATPGQLVTLGGKEAGELRSVAGDWALALLRLKAVKDAKTSGKRLEVDGVAAEPVRPAWMVWPEEEKA
ncbi:MAG: folate-binding protein [Marivibrio sp.]|uniref:CAF17-like 4Fe-4S cluster assembly/insertion protein YgfZ n=1 Tax=Marivibrio sp. TaxID=2039719 RepID=UPI0032EBB11F